MRFAQTIFMIIAFLLAIGCPAGADSFPRGDDVTGKRDESPAAIKFYQKYISGIDGERCSMYPSCSHYSGQAIKKHGWLKGWIMTCDRLMRCGRDEIRLSPPIMIKGRRHAYDPLNQNDIWKVKSSCSPHAPIAP